MPTWPPFSSDGVPGCESAPSVALKLVEMQKEKNENKKKRIAFVCSVYPKKKTGKHIHYFDTCTGIQEILTIVNNTNK